METLVDSLKMESIRLRLKFDACFTVDVQNRNKGLAFLSNATIPCQLKTFHRRQNRWRSVGRKEALPARGRRA
ncbi:hypothetical protein LINGRAHAP2_LOCUS27705 [Linum grandiflorum]